MNYDAPHFLLQLIAIFIVCLVLFHVLFVWLYRITKRQWMYLEYAMILTTLLSLVSASGDVRRRYAAANIDTLKIRAATSHRQFCSSYIDQPPAYVCMKFQRSEMSPENFAEIQQDYDDLCVWFSTIAPIFRASTLPDYRWFDPEQLNLPVLKTDGLSHVINSMKESLSFYNEDALRLSKAIIECSENEFETVLYFIWPYILAAILALSMTKISAGLIIDC